MIVRFTELSESLQVVLRCCCNYNDLFAVLYSCSVTFEGKDASILRDLWEESKPKEADHAESQYDDAFKKGHQT
jgi:hypothetical protein